VNNAILNRSLRMDKKCAHLIMTSRTYRETRKIDNMAATSTSRSASRCREDSKYHRKGATTAEQAVPNTRPTSAAAMMRTSTSNKTSGIVR